MPTILFANGDFEAGEWIQPYLMNQPRIIGVDGGTRHATSLGLTPNLIVGDMDSFSLAERQNLHQRGVTFRKFSTEKDETDLELALLHVVAHEPPPYYIVAGLGGRLDQLLGNILLLSHPELIHHSINFVDPYQTACVIQGKSTIQGEVGDTVSLLPIGGNVHVAQTQGLKWPLVDDWLKVGPARGVSNVLTHDEAIIELHSGLLVCVQISQKWRR